eukprot:160912-Pyramimonas_sp.AAC.1
MPCAAAGMAALTLLSMASTIAVFTRSGKRGVLSACIRGTASLVGMAATEDIAFRISAFCCSHRL